MEETEFKGRVNEALGESSDYDRFCSLGEVARDTSSSNMLPEIKAEKIKEVESLQMGLVDGLARELK